MALSSGRVSRNSSPKMSSMIESLSASASAAVGSGAPASAWIRRSCLR